MIPLKDDIPSESFPIVTIIIISLNILVFLYQFSMGRMSEGFNFAFGAIPYEIAHFKDIPPFIPFPPFFTVFTSMFMHGGIIHIIGNMLYLWIFGDNVEDAMGHIRFFLFYIICGLCAASVQIAVNPNSMVPLIGASGAIAGVLGAYILLYPRANIYTLIPFFVFFYIIKLPALLVLSLWIVFQMISGSESFINGIEHGGVAWFAHIGGFFAGLILINFFKKKRHRL